MTVILSATNITKTYGGNKALDDVSFNLEKGKILGVVGESGSGKSTLGRIVMRLLQPDTGIVMFRGQELNSLTRRQLRRVRQFIQLVPQDPRNALNPSMSVQDNLRFQFQAQHIARGTWKSLERELLAKVSLTADYLHAFPRELSGGQAQRVAIARALSSNPEVLVCDEAVSALDKSVQAQVLNTFSDLQIELGISMFFITHDLSVVEHISDQILILNRGIAVESGDTLSVLANPGDEYTKRLLAARPPLSAWRGRVETTHQ